MKKRVLKERISSLSGSLADMMQAISNCDDANTKLTQELETSRAAHNKAVEVCKRLHRNNLPGDKSVIETLEEELTKSGQLVRQERLDKEALQKRVEFLCTAPLAKLEKDLAEARQWKPCDSCSNLSKVLDKKRVEIREKNAKMGELTQELAKLRERVAELKALLEGEAPGLKQALIAANEDVKRLLEGNIVRGQGEAVCVPRAKYKELVDATDELAKSKRYKGSVRMTQENYQALVDDREKLRKAMADNALLLAEVDRLTPSNSPLCDRGFEFGDATIFGAKRP